MEVAIYMHGVNVRMCLYFEFTKLKLRLTWVFVDLNLNLQSSDLHGS